MSMSVKTIESVIANGGKLIGTGKTNGVQVFKTMLKDGGYQLDSFTKSGQPFKEIVKDIPIKSDFSQTFVGSLTDSFPVIGSVQRTTWKNFLTGARGEIRKGSSKFLDKTTVHQTRREVPLEKGTVTEILTVADNKSIGERIFRKPSSARQSEYYYEYLDNFSKDSTWNKNRVLVRPTPPKNADIYVGFHIGGATDAASPHLKTNLEGYKQLVKHGDLEHMPRTMDDIIVLLDKLKKNFKAN